MDLLGRRAQSARASSLPRGEGSETKQYAPVPARSPETPSTRDSGEHVAFVPSRENSPRAAWSQL